MIVKAKRDVTVYAGCHKKKVFLEGKEYSGYKSQNLNGSYIIVDENKVLNAVSPQRFKTNFVIISE